MRHFLMCLISVASLFLIGVMTGAAMASDDSAKGAIRPRGPSPAPPPAAARPSETRDQRPAASLDRMIGQMIMVGFVGKTGRDPGVAAILDQLRGGIIGGAILMGRNIESPVQLKKLTSMLRAASKEGKQETALIAVDQEGGHVQRLKQQNGHQSFPYSARSIAERCTPEQAGRVYKALACQLNDAGINVNFGPVVDLDINGTRNPIIGKYRRSFGKDPDRVVEYAGWFNGAHKDYGILTAAKHFPGHGSSLTDSHAEFTDLTKTWSPEELKPYQSLLKYNYADMVMVGHLYHRRFSDGKAPASLSSRAIEGELRGKLEFKGVVITDDLQMKAVLDHYPLRERVPMAVNAGNDIVLLSNTVKPYPGLGKAVHDIIRRMVRESCPPGTAKSCIERRTIEAAYRRVMAMKARLAAMDVPASGCKSFAPVTTLVKQICKKTGLGRAGEAQRRRQTQLMQRQ